MEVKTVSCHVLQSSVWELSIESGTVLVSGACTQRETPVNRSAITSQSNDMILTTEALRYRLRDSWDTHSALNMHDVNTLYFAAIKRTAEYVQCFWACHLELVQFSTSWQQIQTQSTGCRLLQSSSISLLKSKCMTAERHSAVTQSNTHIYTRQDVMGSA